MKQSTLTRILAPRGWAIAATAVALFGLGSAQAQIGTGGKGGGLPGGGPGTSTGPPGGSTGGRTMDDLDAVYHVLDRITYGATSDDLDMVRQMGLDNYIRLQLNPTLIPESSVLTTRQASLPPVYTPVGDPRWDWNALYTDHIWRARYTTRQLNEVMTQFWENHFDTGLDTGAGGFTGFYTSLRYDPATNEATIAYYDQSQDRPRFARRVGTTWTQQDIESQRQNGTFTSLAYNPVTQLPSVSYYSARNQELKLASWNGTAWTIQVVDTTGNVGGWTSLAFDAGGTAFISYYDYTNQELKVASGTALPFTIEVVDSAGDVGWFSSLALDGSGRPSVAYYDNTNAVLKYASRNGASWNVEVVDASPGAGLWSSLAFDGGGTAVIAYRDAAQTSLRYARRGGTPWTLTTVDDTGDVGEYSSLAIDLTGNPGIAYFDRDNYSLKVARFAGTSWTVQTALANANIEGEWSSLRFHPTTGFPAVSHHNGSQFSLRLAEHNGSAWGAARTVDSYGTSLFRYTVWEMLEMDGFRQNALGKFRDLLDVSAKSAAMMLFLNNNENTAGNGNENYARELLELHTLSVDGGYTQTDVETTARALTGWGVSLTSPRCDVRVGDFCYNHLAHDGSAKTILGQTFSADSLPNDASAWMRQGNEILDFLSRRPETARFVCHKLIQKFVNDAPPVGLHNQCISTFLNSDGDIKRVMELLLFSPEFLGPDNRLNKVRDPFEFSLAAARHLEADADGVSLYYNIATMSMPLFRMTVPTGYPEGGVDWVSTNGLLQHWRYADALTHATRGTVVNPLPMVAGLGITTADGVVKYFADRLLRGQLSALEQSSMIDCLNNAPAGPAWDITRPEADGRLRDTVGIMLGFPVYQKQ